MTPRVNPIKLLVALHSKLWFSRKIKLEFCFANSTFFSLVLPLLVDSCQVDLTALPSSAVEVPTRVCCQGTVDPNCQILGFKLQLTDCHQGMAFPTVCLCCQITAFRLKVMECSHRCQVMACRPKAMARPRCPATECADKARALKFVGSLC